MNQIKLVVLDWAGTAVDFGCFAPVRPFVEALQRVGLTISEQQARGPMGLAKRDHLEALFRLPEAAAQWRSRHRREWNQDDVDLVYRDYFMPLQIECAGTCSAVITGLLEAVDALHRRGIKVGTTTGYFREAAEVAFQSASQQGYQPDHNVIPADVSAGRPAPWMIYRNMEALGVYPPAAVVKVGDTVFDIEEGLNAGAWSVGVTDSSSDVGLTQEQFSSLPDYERQIKITACSHRLRAAGAHDIIRTVAELPTLIDRIETRLKNGERPA